MNIKSDKRTSLFESVPIPKAVVTLCVPTIISSLVMVLYNLADTYFVGILNDPVQNAAVTMSRALGRKDFDTVHKSSAFGFYCALFCGIVFSLLCTIAKAPLLALLGADDVTLTATAAYMHWTVTCGAVPAILNVVLAYMVRSEGASFHASIGTMSGCLLNIVLDPIFILPWGLNMGAAGAGLATFLSNCVACLYFFILLYIRRNSTCVCIRPRAFCLQKDIMLGVFGVGIPASIQNLLNVTGMTILNNFTSAFGADAVAAMGITQKIYMVPMYVCMGISQGIMPLVSYNYASGNRKRMRSSIVFSGSISVGFITAAALFFFVGADSVVRFFMDNVSIIGYGVRFLRGFCLGLPFLCMDFLAVGVFQALGYGRKALVFAIMRKIILEIPALFLLNFLFPLYGLAYAQFCAEFVLAVAAVVELYLIFRKLEKKSVYMEDV